MSLDFGITNTNSCDRKPVRDHTFRGVQMKWSGSFRVASRNQSPTFSPTLQQHLYAHSMICPSHFADREHELERRWIHNFHIHAYRLIHLPPMALTCQFHDRKRIHLHCSLKIPVLFSPQCGTVWMRLRRHHLSPQSGTCAKTVQPWNVRTPLPRTNNTQNPNFGWFSHLVDTLRKQ